MIDAAGIRGFMKGLGSVLAHETRIYLLGGASRVLLGWRESTDAIDITVVPDREIARILPRLTQDEKVDVLLRAPDQFIPPLPGWEERSPPIGQEGRVTFLHLDFYSQALTMIERASARDAEDVREMIARNLLNPAVALKLFDQIEPEFPKYPAIDGPVFRRVVEMVLSGRHPGL
jgi:hypothetical protein